MNPVSLSLDAEPARAPAPQHVAPASFAVALSHLSVSSLPGRAQSTTGERDEWSFRQGQIITRSAST